MREAPWVKMTKREWQAEKRREFHDLEKIIKEHPFFIGMYFLPTFKFRIDSVLDGMWQKLKTNKDWNC